MVRPVFGFSDPLFEKEINSNQWRIDPRPGSLMLDIGANRGGVTALAALNGAHVVAYEPIPTAFSVLLDTIQRNGIVDRVRPVNAAVHLKSGSARFRYNSVRDERFLLNGSLVELGDVPETDYLESDVPTEAIEKVFGDSFWDIVKIDIEGYEFPLLLGCPDRVLDQIGFLTMELHHDFRESGDYEALIERLGKFFVLDGLLDANQRFNPLFGTRRTQCKQVITS